jgi:glycosyltransferase involved in cell wall biosynthesis
MRANIFPIYSKSLIVYKEALTTISENKFFEISKVEKCTIPTLKKNELPEILFLTTYPPRECGIATYTQDLKNAIKEKFGKSFSLKIGAFNAKDTEYSYPDEVKYVLHTDNEEQYTQMAKQINADNSIAMIFLQHEFGLFGGENGDYILKLLSQIKKPVSTTFHTVLPNPNAKLKKVVRKIVDFSDSVVVMTKTSATILRNDYGIAIKKIAVIPHGTHLVSSDEIQKKHAKIHLADRIVLSTFGLISEGKSIETAINALPKIIEKFPNV